MKTTAKMVSSPTAQAPSVDATQGRRGQDLYGNAFAQEQLAQRKGGELMLRAMTDANTFGPAAVAQGLVGHAWVHLRRDDGTRSSWGFWPRNGYDPQNPAKDVPGIVRAPDPHDGDQQAVRRYDVDADQVERLEDYAEAHESSAYNLLTYNCTDFAVGMVSSAGQAAPDSSTLGVDYPNALKEGIVEANAEEGLDDKGRDTTP